MWSKVLKLSVPGWLNLSLTLLLEGDCPSSASECFGRERVNGNVYFSICCAESVTDSAKEWEKYSTVFWLVLFLSMLIIWCHAKNSVCLYLFILSLIQYEILQTIV